MISKIIKKNIILKLIKNYSLLGYKLNITNPKIGPYLLSLKNNYVIFDLIKTLKLLKLAGNIVKNVTNNAGKILFIGIDNNFFNLNILELYASKTNSFFVTKRWIGGLLTNWYNTQKLITRLNYLESFNNNFTNISKKKISKYKKELYRLQQLFTGIKHMNQLPDLVIFINQDNNMLAINECLTLGIPIISILDSKNDPNKVPFAIPVNQNSYFSIHLILNYLTNQISSL